MVSADKHGTEAVAWRCSVKKVFFKTQWSSCLNQLSQDECLFFLRFALDNTLLKNVPMIVALADIHTKYNIDWNLFR